MRNVRVGCRDEGENAGLRHAGTACRVLPRETWRCVPCKSYGMREEGRGKREKERGKKVCVCVVVCVLCVCACVVVVGVDAKTRGSLGHFQGPLPKDV